MKKLKELLGNTRIRSLPDYVLKHVGFALWPIDITFYLTFSCNNFCPHCYHRILEKDQASGDKSSESSSPSLSQYERFIKECSFLKPQIRLSGGEPFLYPHLLELTDFIKECGLNLTISTNGSLLAPNAHSMLDLRVDVVIISLYGPACVHDRIVQRKGAFHEIENGIRTIVALKRKRNSCIPRIIINYILTNDNYLSFPEMVQWAENIGGDTITLTHLWFWDPQAVAQQNRDFPEFGLLKSTPNLALRDIDPHVLVRNVDLVQRKTHKIQIIYFPLLGPDEIITYYQQPDQHLGARRCIIPWTVSYVFPNGDLKPCYLNYSTGNIKEQSYKQIWNGKKFRTFRIALAKHGYFPACKRCTGLFLFNGNKGYRISMTQHHKRPD
ncbi:SPASM domain-containing protein [bacterium]|nr:SPASM domain-containing protein [bacterium]